MMIFATPVATLNFHIFRKSRLNLPGVLWFAFSLCGGAFPSPPRLTGCFLLPSFSSLPAFSA
ncbi:hypothetical protein N658DRAFT_496168 [Parathielavia hyrcaniae]|uniref:Uncharacterized protein n=1 Tax=Parathielavia hyrcaniae TaxID=113614 RepID=A0AAN6T2J6_9PEZI|nr:hypothetical protein N658DRAFT_496168 [Parathielavia hyrcaniae]